MDRRVCDDAPQAAKTQINKTKAVWIRGCGYRLADKGPERLPSSILIGPL